MKTIGVAIVAYLTGGLVEHYDPPLLVSMAALIALGMLAAWVHDKTAGIR